MNNIVLSKNNIEMKRIGWLVSIGLLLVITGFCYFRFSNADSPKKITGDNSTSMDSTKILVPSAKEDLPVDSSTESEVNSGPNIDNNPKKSAITSTENRISKKNSDTLNLRDFGVIGNGNNETVGFQKALDASIGKVLFIPKQQGKYYLTRQLRIPSNTKLFFDSNVILQATDDLVQKQPNFEVLFRIENSNNIFIEGNNAVLRMNKSAYNGEHNHIVMINGSRDIKIQNLNTNNSGGDGVYIGAYKTKRRLSENIILKNIKSHNNRRQGLSVISVKNLRADDCKFSSTVGALPEAGVDIEPSLPSDILENIIFKNCLASSNNGRGFQVILIKLDAKSSPVDITFENCKAVNNDVGFSNRYFNEVSKGKVRFLNCTSEGSKAAGFWEGSCAASGAAKEYRNCVAINNNVGRKSVNNGKEYFGFEISNFDKRKKKILGNSIFINCKAINNSKNSRLDYGINLNDNVQYQNVVVQNFVSEGGTKEKIKANSNHLKSKSKISVF